MCVCDHKERSIEKIYNFQGKLPAMNEIELVNECNVFLIMFRDNKL